MIRFLPFTLVFIFVASCSILKPKYYNDLNKEDKIKYTPINIDLKNHKLQEKGIYSINSNELINLLKGDINSINVVVFNKITCSDQNKLSYSILKNFNNISEQIYLISADDWVYKNHYEAFLLTKLNGLINKIYLLDNNEYGKYEGWHDNQTYYKRLAKFYSELKRIDNYELISENIYGIPDVLIFNKDEIIFEYLAYDCESAEECDQNYKTFIKYIKSLIK